MMTVDMPQPAKEQQFSRQFLRDVRYRDADQRIDALSRLPDLIQGATDDRQLFSRVVNVLLTGVARSDRAAIVDASNAEAPKVLHWDSTVRATISDFQPSQRLIVQAIETGESVIHQWAGESASSFTQRDDSDWAFCIPLPGTACRGWVLYLSGCTMAEDSVSARTHHSIDDFQDDMKFAQSAAAMVGNLREVRQLERGNAALGQFFSPVVVDMLAVEDPDKVLVPRETQISVMFCDLRGFSLHSEQSADDLFGLLDRVSQALGVVTHHILSSSGVVGDFQGDSVMGFWGWPMKQSDAAARACMAALKIRREIVEAERQTNHPLGKFKLGIGIATGTAVAGKIGTVDQFKVTVFGPVVNLASRLEGMTKRIAPIVMDRATADLVSGQMSIESGRIRDVATVQPFGLTSCVDIFELLLPESEFSTVNAEQLSVTNEAALAIRAGNWERSRELLSQLSPNDQLRRFLEDELSKLDFVSPPDWDGVIRIGMK